MKFNQLQLIISLLKVYLMPKKIFRSYSYVIFGIENVGKTNIITRFVKDQFNEAHKVTLGGTQQSNILIDGHIFRINLHDTAGQIDEVLPMKNILRQNKQGFIYTFSLNCENSFHWVLKQIQEVRSMYIYQDTPIIMVGNKSDLVDERKIAMKTAKQATKKLGVKYYQISAKQSPKEQIDHLIHELVDMNEMGRFFCSLSQNFQSLRQPKLGCKVQWHPCESSLCQIM